MENEKEVFEKAFGLDVDKMTSEQKNILRNVVSPSKLNWLSIVGMGIALSGIISLFQSDFLWFFILVVVGVLVFLMSFFILRHRAFAKYKETVTSDEYAEFRKENCVLDYYVGKYGKLCMGLCMIIGLIYLFFDWRIGITIFFFGMNILSDVYARIVEGEKTRWSWIIFYFVVLIVVWLIYPPQ